MDSEIGVDMKRPAGSKSHLCRRLCLIMETTHKIGRVILVDGIRQCPRSMWEIADIRTQDACIETGCHRAIHRAIDICPTIPDAVDQVCLACKPPKPFTG
jgi:hypothetical protein